MHTFWRWILVLAVPALWVAAALPAEPIVPNETTVQLILLREKSVQEELKIDAELAKKIMEFTNAEYEEFQKAQKLSEEEREKKLKQLEEANQKFLADNLSAGQRKRLGQIAMQVTGLQQLTKPEIAKLLDLTEEQQKKFKEMRVEARKELERIMDVKNRQERNEKLAKLREDIERRVKEVLTDEQKAKARELVGEPFKGKILLEGPEEGSNDKPEK
jgi:hypothetical protein